MRRSISRVMGAALALLGSTALAQATPDPIGPLPAPGAARGAPAAPVADVPPAAPVALPPPVWSVDDATDLLGVVNTIGSEGLTPGDYNASQLAAAIQSRDPGRLSAVATDSFNHLSSDLALGHVRGEDRIDWHVVDPDIDFGRQRALLEGALAQHRIPDALRGLLPTHPQYGALRTALAEPRNAAMASVIRLNMDRWRWLPRDLGGRYIIANVPAYTATLVDNGVAISRHKAVAGAIKTPTPQLSAIATGVILNPWWEVPTSISKEVAGKNGFVPVTDPKTGKITRWRQPPGPSNALGQMKFVMPNQYAIYLHDTNAKSRFNSQVRAFSHGCIRTDRIGDLARLLLAQDNGAWTDARVSAALASKKTTSASFARPLPVYIVYFTVAATLDGTIVNYDDVYKRDGTVIAALFNKPRAKPKSTAPEAGLATSATTAGDATPAPKNQSPALPKPQ